MTMVDIIKKLGLPVEHVEDDEDGNQIVTIQGDWQILCSNHGNIIVMNCGVARHHNCTLESAIAYVHSKIT